MNSILLELSIIFVLLIANGVFSMAEIAVVSARKARLRQMAQAGDARAGLALGLAESPNNFLATVQIGITLVGVLAAAFSGATMTEKLAGAMKGVEWLAPYADKLAFGVVVVVLTYFTLVIGELVPKRLGLGNPEGVARAVAGPMRKLSVMGRPLVSLLGWSTDGLLKIFRIKPEPEVTVTEDEVKLLVREGMRAGVFHASEPAMVENVMALDRIPVRDLMTPRAKIIWINVNDPHDSIWHKIVVSGHTTFPVYEGNRDQVVGVITVKAIYANLAAGVGVQVKVVDGMIEAAEFERLVPGFRLHPAGERDYQTFAGFVVKHLGHVPHEGDSFQLHGYLVEVIDMDGHRVDKVLLMPVRNRGTVSTNS